MKNRNGLFLILILQSLVANSWAQDPVAQSHYVTMDDGVKLAVDVYLPDELESEKKAPALLELTRYWRASYDPETGKPIQTLGTIDRGFLKRGYAIVKVDVRGSGASFGHRLEEYGPRETRDGYALIDWVVHQSWCDGNIGAYGVSYSGTTAEFLAASKHPALKAVIPGWSDFDIYTSPGRPYGLVPEGFIDQWSEMVGRLDRNDVEKLGMSVRPVDPGLLPEAVAEHAKNPNVAELVRALDYRDVGFEESRPMSECASRFWKKDIEASGVPMLVFASWLDAGTADGALLRFQNYSNRQYLVILASSHGGMWHASPLVVGDRALPPIPSLADQFELRLQFFNHFLRGEDNDVRNWPAIRYFNMGEEQLRATDQWPVSGIVNQKFYCREDHKLSPEPPTESAIDEYAVDFEVNTGRNNRWTTQMGTPVLRLDHREAMDERMLCYTSEPLEADLQLIGSPLVSLAMRTSANDGAVLAYLEAVSPSGQSRYISEGGLRFRHRLPVAHPPLIGEANYHSFARFDSMPVAANDTMIVPFKMWPTSVRIPQGDRIRLAMAGADSRVFGRVPAGDEAVTWQVLRDEVHPSTIELPIQTTAAPVGQ